MTIAAVVAEVVGRRVVVVFTQVRAQVRSGLETFCVMVVMVVTVVCFGPAMFGNSMAGVKGVVAAGTMVVMSMSRVSVHVRQASRGESEANKHTQQAARGAAHRARPSVVLLGSGHGL